ncbi:MAG: hypothetical protein AAFR51_08820 [Pseudomonadota bacterium]
MAETSRTIPDTGIADRYTGRETDEFGVDSELTLEEKIQRFEESEIALMQAEAHLKDGANKAEIYGELQDVRDAVVLLSDSARYHADAFTKDELRQAANDRLIDPSVLEAIADRRSPQTQKAYNAALAEQLRSHDEGRSTEAEQVLDQDRDQER